MDERDTVVGKVYRSLMEIESRLLPCGLHTVGVPPTAAEAVATLVNIAGIDRLEDGIKALPRIIAESVGRNIEDIYRKANDGVLDDVSLLQQNTEATRGAVRAGVDRSTNSEGRVEEVSPLFKEGTRFLENMMNFGQTPWKRSLSESGFPDCKEEDLTPLFEYLEFCQKSRCASNGEEYACLGSAIYSYNSCC